MTEVSVWDRVPTADEILRARVDDGWQPTPSSLQDGDRVLGHGACVAGRLGADTDEISRRESDT